MHSSLGNNNAASDTEYVHGWIESTSKVGQVESELLVSEDADDCLAARLYSSCVQVLRHICFQVSDHRTTPSGVIPRVLREELGRLYLCGDIFRSGKLNKILDNADELRENVLEILAAVGLLLTRSE